jgi:hypothetical protein
MHLIRTAPLVQRLATGKVDAAEQAKYLALSLVVFTVPGYAGLLASAPYPWPFYLEGWFIVSITVLGAFAARDAAQASRNPNFLIEFTCLFVPVAITTLISIWSLYWLLMQLFEKELLYWSYSQIEFVKRLRNLGTDLPGFSAFLAQVVSTGVIFWRVQNLLKKVQAAKVDA